MQVVALAVVKDEGDVFEQCLRHALTWCDRIVVLDNGSTDDTVPIIETLAAEVPNRVHFAGVVARPFSDSMRGLLYNDIHQSLGWDDWLFVLDADEFLDRDPRPLLQRAARRGFDRLATWQAQFQFTEDDLVAWESGQVDASTPVVERLRWYRLDWREARFWRNRPDRKWEGGVETVPTFAGRAPWWAPVNRHYQHRSPEQMQRRIAARSDVRLTDPTEELFAHVAGTDWRELVEPTRGLRRSTPGEFIRPLPWPYLARRLPAPLSSLVLRST